MKTPPPPPTTSFRYDTGVTAPTYWLHSEEGGMTGPFTKKDAREFVAQSPGTPFLACREGEDWQDAAVRLAPRKSDPTKAIVSTVLIIVLVAVAGFGFKKWQDHQRDGKRMTEMAAGTEAGQVDVNNASSQSHVPNPVATVQSGDRAANAAPVEQAGSSKPQPGLTQ
jgi:hypothetical protein